jgi:large subunit ribosomal protein L25
MDAMRIPAKRRTETGKGVARGLRREGEIPAVVYGKAEAPISLAVPPKAVHAVFGSELGQNSVIELEVDGGDKVNVLLADYQYHPVSRNLLHVDFLRISLGEPVRVEVPFELVGKAAGVAQGGVLRKVFRKLPVSCLPANIPARIEYDVTEMDVDAHVAVSGLNLPEGVTVRLPENQTVCAVIAEKKVVEEEEEKSGAAEGEAAAPAEGAAPPAATS